MLSPEKVFVKYTYKSIEDLYFDEDEAIVQLLSEGILFTNFFDYSHGRDKNDKVQINGRSIVLFVNCNDVFAWGCSDAEDIRDILELKQLYNLCVEYPKWGSAIWCCLKRKMKPQAAVESKMKDMGEWPEELYGLQENSYNKYLREQIIKRDTENGLFVKEKK